MTTAMTPRHQTRRYLSQPMSSPIVRQIGEALFPARPTTPLVQRGCRTLVPCQTALEDTRSVDATSAWQPRPSQLHSEAWRPPPLELSGDAANGFRYSMRPLPEPTPPLLPSRLGHHIGSPAHVSNRRARAQPQASRSPVLASQLGAAPLFDTLHCTALLRCGVQSTAVASPPALSPPPKMQSTPCTAGCVLQLRCGDLNRGGVPRP